MGRVLARIVKVAWILYGDLDQRTGGTIYDAQVVAGLRRAGDEVRVFSLRPNGPVVSQARGLARELAELGADVVVGDELCFRELALTFRMLRETRRVLLVHHLTAWEEERSVLARRLARFAESAALSAADTVVTTSETTRARLRREGARPDIAVVLRGADRLAGRRADTADIRLVFLGSITERKRVVPLVRAFAARAAATATLSLIGSTTRDPAYVARVREAIDAAGVAARVELRGELEDDAVARTVAESDALVMPSSLEGYGIAATEALWMGVPVIAARAPGLEEALAPYRDACLFVSDDAMLRSTLHAFTHDPGMRASLAAAAADAHSRLPTWAACATGFRDVLGA